MVRTSHFWVVLQASCMAATLNHATLLQRTDEKDTKRIASSSSEALVKNSKRDAINLGGQYQAYLHHEHARLRPTTFLTATTAVPYSEPIALPTTTQDVRRRQLGLLGGLLGGVGGIVSTLLGGLQPAVTAALAPIQSAANTHLPQISLVQSLAPQVSPTADVISPVASAANPILGALLGNIISAVAPIVQNVGGIASDVAAPIESLAAPIQSAVAGPVQAAVGPLISALAPAVAAALSPVADAMGNVASPAAADLLAPLESAVAPLLGNVVSAAVGVAGGIENPVADALRPILGAVDSAVLPLASSVVGAVWPAIAPIITPLNPVVCALQPLEAPIGGDATALIPVQCVSVTSGNMVPVSTGVATVTSPQGLLSITPALPAPALDTNAVLSGNPGALPGSGASGPPAVTPTTTIVAPLPSNAAGSPLAGSLHPGSNGPTVGQTVPAASAVLPLSPLLPAKSVGGPSSSSPGAAVPGTNQPGLSQATSGATSRQGTTGGMSKNSNFGGPTTAIASSALSGTFATSPGSGLPALSAITATPLNTRATISTLPSNPLGSAAARASSFLAGLGTASSVFGMSISLPTLHSTRHNSTFTAKPSLSTRTVSRNSSALGGTGSVSALPAVIPSSAMAGNVGTASGYTSPDCSMMAFPPLSAGPPANLPNVPAPPADPTPPASPVPVATPIPSADMPPVGGTTAAATPAITSSPSLPQGGLIMLAYGTNTVTFGASQLPGGGLVASISGSAYAFPAATAANGVRLQRRDGSAQPDYNALAMALVSLLQSGERNLKDTSGNVTSVAGVAVVADKDASLTSQSTASATSVSSSNSPITPWTTQPVAETATDLGGSSSSAGPYAGNTTSTSMDPAASGASLSISSCPDINGTSYLSRGGSVYQIICGTNWIGRDVQPWRSTPDFEACVAECDALNAGARNRPCAAVLFVPDAPQTAANCYPKYSVDNPTNDTGGFTFQAAVLHSSGTVVDNGVGMVTSHAQVKDKAAEPSNLLNNSGLDQSSSEVALQGTVVSVNGTLINATTFSNTTGTASAEPSANTLDLTSGTTLGGLNMSSDNSSNAFLPVSSASIMIVYATGTAVIEPVLSTTLMLGAASNQPVGQYFDLTAMETAGAIAKRGENTDTQISASASLSTSAAPQWREIRVHGSILTRPVTTPATISTADLSRHVSKSQSTLPAKFSTEWYENDLRRDLSRTASLDDGREDQTRDPGSWTTGKSSRERYRKRYSEAPYAFGRNADGSPKDTWRRAIDGSRMGWKLNSQNAAGAGLDSQPTTKTSTSITYSLPCEHDVSSDEKTRCLYQKSVPFEDYERCINSETIKDLEMCLKTMQPAAKALPSLDKAEDGGQIPFAKRDDGLLHNFPNAYNPISNNTGANFALSTTPIDSDTGTLLSNGTKPLSVSNMTSVPRFSRDGGKGGMVSGRHLFLFADTGVYTTQSDGSNGHFIGFSSSSVATDSGQHGIYGNSVILQDGVGEFADGQGSLRGFVPLTTGETGWNQQAMAAGVNARYAVWPESSLIPLDSQSGMVYAPIVYDVVDNTTKSADFTYTGNTLLSVTVDDIAGPVAQRLVGRLFNATDVEWGCVGGIRSWGASGVGGRDGRVYVLGNTPGGLLMARTDMSNVADTDKYEYWSGSGWTSGSLAPDSTAYVLQGSFMDVDIFYSPRHLTFVAVYTTIYGDNTLYWRYLEAPQALLPSYAGGDPDADVVEAITKNPWSDEHVLFKMGGGLNGGYSYAAGVHLGYFGQNDISNGGDKMLLSWTSPTGQDAASRNSAFQLMTGVVTWD